MNKKSRTIFGHYAGALIAVSIAVGLKLLLEPWLKGITPLLPFVIAVVFSAWYGGFGPGIFATILSFLAGAYFFFEPIYSLGVEDRQERTRIILFLLVGIIISVFCESFRRAKKRAEQDAQRAKESEAQFRTMANSIPQLVWMASADGYIFWYNQRWFDYTGTTPEEMEGWGWQSVHDPEILPQVLECWRGSIATGEPFEMEFPLRGADGVFRTFLTRVEPLKDSNGAVVRWFGTNTDVDESRKAAEKLRETERAKSELLERLNEAQRLAKIGSWEWDLRADSIWWSDETYRIFEVDPLEYIPTFEANGKFIHPEDHDGYVKSFEHSVGTGEPLEMDVRLITKNGILKYISALGKVFHDDLNEPVRFIGMVTDITERKQAEEALRSLTEQLRALSARLQSAREEEAARIAREIHDEFGQALTGIILELSWLEEQIFERGGADLVTKIRSTIKLAAEMVDTVRRIATELRPGLLDDFGLLATIEWQAREFEKRTGTRCAVRLDPICANLPRQISTSVFRILQESLTNIARHASAAQVDIELIRKEDILYLEVVDDGRGAGAKELADSRSLGILGMRERALMLGGEVKITGKPGAGTTVEVSIPLPGASASNGRDKWQS